VTRPGLALAAACAGQFLVFVHITATISSLVGLQADLAVTPTGQVWVPTAYTLTVAACVLSAGAVSDRRGRRLALIAGVGGLGVGATVVATAGSLPAVVTGQLVAGIGAALVLPASLGIVTHAFPGPAPRARATAAWVAASGLGLAVGPLVSGGLQAAWSWRASFLAVLPVAAVTALLAARVTESRVPGRGLDPAGQVLAVTGLAAGIVAVVEGGRRGPDTVVLLAAAVSVAALAALVAQESRTRSPMVDVRLFRIAPYSGALLASAVGLFGFVGVTLLQVLYYQRAEGLSPWQTGLRVSVEMAAFVVMATAGGRLAARIGPRPLVVAGLLAAGAGAAVLATQRADGPFALAAVGMVLLGGGSGLLLGPATAAAVGAVPPSAVPMAVATVNAARQLGTVIGAATLGSVLAAALAGRAGDVPLGEAFLGGVSRGAWLAAAVSAVTAVVAGLTLAARSTAGTGARGGGDRLGGVPRSSPPARPRGPATGSVDAPPWRLSRSATPRGRRRRPGRGPPWRARPSRRRPRRRPPTPAGR
jgi:DHA2 family multidrug resistance protein-like MFS transporter